MFYCCVTLGSNNRDGNFFLGSIKVTPHQILKFSPTFLANLSKNNTAFSVKTSRESYKGQLVHVILSSQTMGRGG